MPFSKPLPVWNAPGTEPPQGKKDAGWLASEKPPADWWNWYKYTNYQAVQELQQNALHKNDPLPITDGSITEQKLAFNPATQAELDAHQVDYVKHPGFGVTTGSVNTYAVTLNPAPTAYTDGMAVSVKINTDSTGASTLNVNGLGAKPLKKANGNDATNLKVNGVYTFRYNSSTGNFILQGEGGNGNAVAGDVLTGKTFSNDAGDQVGIMPNRGSQIITPGTANVTIPVGYHDGSGYVQGDADLIASNIRSGINIFGVGGTLVPLNGEKKFATGSVTSTPNQAPFYTYDELDGSGAPVFSKVTVTGLTFTPSIIILYCTGGNSDITIYDSGNRLVPSYAGPQVVATQTTGGNASNILSSGFKVTGNASVTSSGFSLPTRSFGSGYQWIAYE